MKNRLSYTYVLLRYRHDPATGEFANVGVVLHSPDHHFLGVKVRHTVGRLSKMFPGLDSDTLKSSLRTLEGYAKKIAKKEADSLLTGIEDAHVFAKRILPEDDSSFVWGQLGSGLTDDPAVTLEKLYQRFVAIYDEPHREHKDDAAVWRPVREKLADRKIADRLTKKRISSSVDSVEFEHAWKNGAWHCYQPLSFDLTTDEYIREKARRWAGQMLSLKGSETEFRPYFLVGAPDRKDLFSSYEAAIEILKLSPNNPQIFEESQVDELVGLIEDEIRAHDQSET